MITINAPSPFSKKQQLRIEVAQEGYFTLQGFTADGKIIDADTLISSLFFSYEANIYGLLTNRADFTIEVSSAELLDIFPHATSIHLLAGTVQMRKVRCG